MTVLSLCLSIAVNASRLSGVIVYPDRAQVTRELTIPCGPRAAAIFEQLPPAADPSSFRGRTDVGELVGLRSEERIRSEAFAKERADVERQIHVLEMDVAAVDEARARAVARQRVGDQYVEVAVALTNREMAASKPDVKAWSEAFDSGLNERLKGAAESVAQNAQRRELTYKLEDLRPKLRRMEASARRREFVAEVLVTCPAGRQARVQLSYIVGGAAWQPVYEARADEAGHAVELATFATVEQSTGEDWTQASLILSTAVPLENATPPEIRALKVFSEKAEEKKIIVRRDEYQEHAETSAVVATDQKGAAMKAASQGLSVQLIVPGTSDVPMDGKPVRLFVARTKMKAAFAFRTVPKLLPFVFRVADLSNSAPFPLLPGSVDAYGYSGFISRYPLEHVAQGGTFHLTFGVDDQMRVKRTVVEEVQRDAGLFRSIKRYRYAYRLEIANYRGRPEQLELSEHVPISELDDVKVEMDQKTSPGAQMNKQDGIATWEIQLAPSEQRTLELAFHVDVPASYE